MFTADSAASNVGSRGNILHTRTRKHEIPLENQLANMEFHWKREIAHQNSQTTKIGQFQWKSNGKVTVLWKLQLRFRWKMPPEIHWQMPLTIHDDVRGVDFWCAICCPCIKVYVYLSLSLSLSLYSYIYIYREREIDRERYIITHIHIYIYMYTYIYIYMCICAYVCVYIYIYICTCNMLSLGFRCAYAANSTARGWSTNWESAAARPAGFETASHV